MRANLIRSYLQKKRLTLIQVTWGERELGGRAMDDRIEESDTATPRFKVFHNVAKIGAV